MSFNTSTGFSSLNSVNAAKGMAGTNRTGSATFTGSPSANTAAGMAQPQQGALTAPMGSSYTRGEGMSAANGVVPGQTMPMANVGQRAPQMSAADMQDPNNAALAGYAFSATQDKPVEASQQPVQAPVAPAPGTMLRDNNTAAQAMTSTMPMANPTGVTAGALRTRAIPLIGDR